MRTAGIREARQNLSTLIELVKAGEEVTITDRGKAVAVLSAPPKTPRPRFPDLSEFRVSLNLPPDTGSRLCAIISEDRDDRI